MGGGGDGERGDGGLLAKKVARQIAERKKQDEVPFQTKAMREIERLQKSTVYRTTVIKVQFPDRVVLQATFASTEGVKDLLDVVKSSLEDDVAARPGFLRRLGGTPTVAATCSYEIMACLP
ncbi:conserved unknown protein [Ectocarpus siliculosus]|uniref:UBX domain-containing protein n=1 Tax=Ectocarpus siliculosus TaxID=2880 RepID=D7FME0_ECTSI|nr:conserved unknown protein [Ectocarpus siliculosus]|eukprot:CBJ34249.1 conserved unknown protein [Ectocarpus siliculosus]